MNSYNSSLISRVQQEMYKLRYRRDSGCLTMVSALYQLRLDNNFFSLTPKANSQIFHLDLLGVTFWFSTRQHAKGFYALTLAICPGWFYQNHWCVSSEWSVIQTNKLILVLWSTQRLSTFMSAQRIYIRHVDIIFNISTKEQWKNKMSIIMWVAAMSYASTFK